MCKFLYCTSDWPLAPQSHAGSSVDLWVSEGGGGARLIRECGKQPETRIVQLLGRER